MDHKFSHSSVLWNGFILFSWLYCVSSHPCEEKPVNRAGQKLLKNSELVEGRRLNNIDNDFNIENIIGQFHLRYTGCYNVLQLSGEGGGGGGDGGGSGIQNGAVVVYELAESCRGSKYIGRYATNMMQFVDSYTESILEEQEWRCENFVVLIIIYLLLLLFIIIIILLLLCKQ